MLVSIHRARRAAAMRLPPMIGCSALPGSRARPMNIRNASFVCRAIWSTCSSTSEPRKFIEMASF
ncbi:hypothetical protein D3C87_2128390 [compost metagenome]